MTARSRAIIDEILETNGFPDAIGVSAAGQVRRGQWRDAKDSAGFADVKLIMPLLVLSGERAGGPFLIEQGKMVASDVKGILVKGSGHWLMEEAPDQVVPELVDFLNR